MQIVSLLGNSRVTVTEAANPTPGPGKVVVRTTVSALCGSELKGYRSGESKSGNNGHEAAGTVIALGSGVTSLAIGQRVGLSAIVGCGECDQCAAGRYTWCANHRFIGNMHAEQICIPAHGCHPLPDDISWEAGVLLSGDGMGVPYHTSTRLRDPAIQNIAIKIDEQNVARLHLRPVWPVAIEQKDIVVAINRQRVVIINTLVVAMDGRDTQEGGDLYAGCGQDLLVNRWGTHPRNLPATGQSDMRS